MSSTIEYRGLSIELPDGAFSFGKDGSLTLSVDAPTTITLRPISDEAGAGVGASVRLPAPAPLRCSRTRSRTHAFRARHCGRHRRRPGCGGAAQSPLASRGKAAV